MDFNGRSLQVMRAAAAAKAIDQHGFHGPFNSG
jgi:hypothetical protein